jgi:hypothetical protein
MDLFMGVVDIRDVGLLLRFLEGNEMRDRAC